MAVTAGRLEADMAAALEGDAIAYRRLLQALRPRLTAYFARRLGRGAADVDDLVQDTLIAVHTRRDTYDRGQPLAPWVQGIARYKLIDHYRRSGRRVAVPLDDAPELAGADDSAAADARGDIERVLAHLPERARDLVRDVKVHEFSMAETAARRSMTETAVKVSVHRALRRLAARFGGGSAQDD